MALVFVPGFFTEGIIGFSGASWDASISQLAKAKDISAHVLQWPSENLVTMFVKGAPAVTAANTVSTVIPAAKVPLALAGALVGRAAWKRAVNEADATARRWEQWTQTLPSRVILAGHSLGGRIALLATACASDRRFEAVFALAPALGPSGLKLEHLAAGASRRPVVFHSKEDTVLNLLFRAGEFTREAALGYEVPSTARAAIEAVDAAPLGHLAYCARFADLLGRHL